MNASNPYSAACCLVATVVCLGTSGCQSDQTRASEFYAEYQAAEAVRDWESARKALLGLVAVEDGVAEYWLALGRVQLQLQAPADAYYAFTRANELDRGNAQTLAALTQLALVSGELEIAKQHAEQLGSVAPNEPAVKLAFGYVALRRQDLDLAEQNADQLLASFPLDPASNLLKARILLARKRPEDAARLLEAQLRSRPDDLSSLKALVALRERNGEWSKVASAAAKVAELDAGNLPYSLLAIEAAFRVNEVERAKELSLQFLQPSAAPIAAEKVLQVWARRWKSSAAVAEVRRLSRQASPQQVLAYATFFNEAGAPADTAVLLGPSPRFPISRANASENALIATSMALRGQTLPAKKVLDAILEKEADHVYALRSRVNLKLRAGMHNAAVIDAQRLVTIDRSSTRDRLLLAQAYAAAGDRRQVDRTLRNAFHEIPADQDLYEALRLHVHRTAGPEAARSVDAEFEHQQNAKFSREFF